MLLTVLFFAAIGVALLWMGVIAPSILRALGVPAAGGLWRLDRRNQHLSRSQYVWGIGVFDWGIGTALATTLLDYVLWKDSGSSSHAQSPKTILLKAAVYLIAGLFVGFVGYSGSPDAGPQPTDHVP